MLIYIFKWSIKNLYNPILSRTKDTRQRMYTKGKVCVAKFLNLKLKDM